MSLISDNNIRFGGSAYFVRACCEREEEKRRRCDRVDPLTRIMDGREKRLPRRRVDRGRQFIEDMSATVDLSEGEGWYGGK